MRRLTTFSIVASLLLLVAARADAVTYTWIGGANGSWTTSTSWSPTRTVAATTDRMVFDSGGSITVINVPNTSIAQVAVTNGTQVIWRPSLNNITMTLNGDAGTDLLVGPGAMLSLESSNTLAIILASGATAQIDGTLRASGANHRLLAPTAGATVFTPGSRALAQPGYMGAMFGTGTGMPSVPGSVIFQPGSTYEQQGGISPFGTAVQQVPVFQPGSLYRIKLANVNIAAGGRTFADVEFDVPGQPGQLSGTAPCTMDNLVVKNGALQLNVTAETTILGDVAIDSSATLDLAATTTIRLGGTATQVFAINYPEPLPFEFNGLNTVAGSRIIFDNPAGVRLDITDRLRMNSTLEFRQGVVYCPFPGYVSLNGVGSTTGGSAATGWWNGYMLDRLVPANPTRTFPFGNATQYAPYTVTVHGVTTSVTVGGAYEDSLVTEVFAGDQLDPVKRLVGQWYYVTVQGDTNYTNFDATFTIHPPVGADPLQFVSRVWGQFNINQRWRPAPTGIRTATTFQVAGMTREPNERHFYFGIGEPGVVNVSVGDPSIEEGGSAAKTPAIAGSGAVLSFPVSLSQRAVETITVDYTTGGGTATAGDDYTPQSGTLTFVPGDTLEVIEVPIVGEGDAEANESLFLVLSNVTGSGAVIEDNVGEGTILDDDDVESPTVTVLAPNGGETFTEGSEIAFFWTANDNVGVVGVDLEVSRDGGATWEPIASDQPNSGSYLWTSTPGLTQQALLRVTAADHRDQQTSDTSDALWSIWATDDVVPVLPTAFALSLASANPSRGTARLRLAMPREQSVRADVYDVAGRRLATLVDGVVPAGVHELQWKGEGAGAGLYFVDLVTNGFRARTRLVRVP